MSVLPGSTASFCDPVGDVIELLINDADIYKLEVSMELINCMLSTNQLRIVSRPVGTRTRVRVPIFEAFNNPVVSENSKMMHYHGNLMLRREEGEKSH